MIKVLVLTNVNKILVPNVMMTLSIVKFVLTDIIAKMGFVLKHVLLGSLKIQGTDVKVIYLD